jgi:hypothetical protein
VRDEPIACTLDAADVPARLTTAKELGARALAGLEVAGGRAVLRFSGERKLIDALIAAESACCSFFQFETKEDGDHIEVEIRTPPGGEPVLRGLVAAVVAGWTTTT